MLSLGRLLPAHGLFDKKSGQMLSSGGLLPAHPRVRCGWSAGSARCLCLRACAWFHAMADAPEGT